MDCSTAVTDEASSEEEYKLRFTKLESSRQGGLPVMLNSVVLAKDTPTSSRLALDVSTQLVSEGYSPQPSSADPDQYQSQGRPYRGPQQSRRQQEPDPLQLAYQRESEATRLGARR